MRAVLMAGGLERDLRPLTRPTQTIVSHFESDTITEHIINLLKRHQITSSTLHYLLTFSRLLSR